MMQRTRSRMIPPAIDAVADGQQISRAREARGPCPEKICVTWGSRTSAGRWTTPMPTNSIRMGVGQRSLYRGTSATLLFDVLGEGSITSSSVPEASPARTMASECRRENIGTPPACRRDPPAMIRSRRREHASASGDAVGCADASQGPRQREGPRAAKWRWRAMAATAVLGTGWKAIPRIFLKELLKKAFPDWQRMVTRFDGERHKPFSRTDAMACRSVSAPPRRARFYPSRKWPCSKNSP